jgi:CRISPR-associated protein Cas2
MSDKSYFTVIAYDVSDNRRRRALVRVLESFGERVQESIFEAWLTDAERKRMEYLARACLKKSEDRLAVYVLPRIDRDDIVSFGMGGITQDFTHLVI